MPNDEIRQGGHIVTVEHRHGSFRNRSVCGNGNNGRIITRQLRMVKFKIAHLDLVMHIALVAFDDDKVAGLQLGKNVIKCGFRIAARFMHDGPAALGDDCHFGSARLAMAEAVTPLMVNVEGMMRMLDGGNAVTARLISSPTSRSTSVVLPAFLKPATPITLWSCMRQLHLGCNVCQVLRAVDVEEGVGAFRRIPDHSPGPA